METKKTGSLMDTRDKILEFIKLNGPVLPVKIAKAIGSDITFAGAILSELIAGKKVKVSNAKIGGSPVYYTPGQEARLQMLEPYLHGREKDAFKLLKEKRLIWEGDTEPWQRVALRDLKDFAVPINVIAEDGSQMHFWKWYVASDEDIKKIIPKYLEPQKKIEQIASQEIQIKQEAKPLVQVKQDIRQTRQEVLQDFVGEVTREPAEERTVKELIKPEKVKKIKTHRISGEDDVYNYLSRKGIDLLSKETAKKGKEIDMVAYVPSGLGRIKFFIAYRNKSKINEADLSIVFGKGQVRNMPVILLSNGELTKKAKEYLERDFRSVTFYKL